MTNNYKISAGIIAVLLIVVSGGIGFKLGEEHIKSQIKSSFEVAFADSDDEFDDEFDDDDDALTEHEGRFGDTLTGDTDPSVAVTAKASMDVDDYDPEFEDVPDPHVALTFTMENTGDSTADLTMVTEPEVVYGDDGRVADWNGGDDMPDSLRPGKKVTATFQYDVPAEESNNLTASLQLDDSYIFQGGAKK